VLSDTELRAEAATWSAFLNPIFCQARGCSTKLATALGWEIPIVTTPVGARGYVQVDGALTSADGPMEFAERLLDIHARDEWRDVRNQTIRVARSTPRMDVIAVDVLKFFGFDMDTLRPSGSMSLRGM
jgi:hypothetical protein